MIRDIGVPVTLETNVLIFLKDVLGVPNSILRIGRTSNHFQEIPKGIYRP